MGGLKIIFLGTGGGRFVTITQKRRTAGIRLLSDKANLHLDPGPGALVHSWASSLDPRRINGILVSHAHPDHYTDAEILVEAMTIGATCRQGVLAAARSVLKGGRTAEVAVSHFHQGLPERVIEVRPWTEFSVGDVKIVGTEAQHSDIDAVGFRFKTSVGDIGYTSDTSFSEKANFFFEGVRLLILCVLRPSGEPWKGHMTVDDAIEILNATNPQYAVLTHFGMKMLLRDPTKEARRAEKESGIRTIAAKDGLELIMNDKIRIGSEHIGERIEGSRLDNFLK